MSTVRIISKPVAPPWNDASKNLVRVHLVHASRFAYRFFGTPDSRTLERERVSCDLVHRKPSRFAPSATENLRPFLYLLLARDDAAIDNYVFTPNRRTTAALRILADRRRRPTVHTVCSRPAKTDDPGRVFFADRNVTMSDHSARILRDAGVNSVTRIYPGIEEPVVDAAAVQQLRSVCELPEGRPCIVFSGDYEFSNAHPTILGALPDMLRAEPELKFVFACRPKTHAAGAIEQSVRAAVSRESWARSVTFLGDIPSFHSLLALSTAVVFPVTSLSHKMDLPLTLIEAMALGRPIVVSDVGPLHELLPEEAGSLIPASDPAALARACIEILRDGRAAGQMGAAGRRIAGTRFSGSRMVSEFESLYSDLLR